LYWISAIPNEITSAFQIAICQKSWNEVSAPAYEDEKGFSFLKRVKSLHVNGRIPYGGLLSRLNAYSQILEFIQIHDFLEEIKFNFFKYSFECAEQLQQVFFCSVLF